MEKLSLVEARQTGKFGFLVESDAGYINPKDTRNKQFVNELKKINTSETFAIVEPLVVTVVLQKYGIENANGRIYPELILRAQAKLYQVLIDESRAVGELNHPDDSVLNGERLSHNITKIWWEGHTLMGEMEVLMSPGYIKYGVISCQGDHVANLLRKGIRIGVSSRGVGSVESFGGKDIVQDDFEIIGWDVVVTPSTPGSWILKNRESAQPFIESEKKEKNLLIDKLDTFLL